MRFYRLLIATLLVLILNPVAYAKWDEERDMTTNGKEELIYTTIRLTSRAKS